ncbi:MAG TPA: FHA domain-containing protein [Tepidisphaeraceae bacterium]
MAYLVIYTPNSSAQKMKLEGTTVVGRSMDCDFWIDDQKLSRKHCRIEHRREQWVLSDLDSMNGTFLHRSRLHDEHVLSDGDIFEIGHVKIVFREGEFVAYRPTDPIEAATMGHNKAIRPSHLSDLENTTIMGQRLPQVRVMPPDAPKDDTKKTTPMGLPFKRPPARPIVKHEPDDPDRTAKPSTVRDQSSRWLDAIVSRLRRR